MFNEKRIEDIRNKIQASTLLSDHEKADWLNLLTLMNDKQLTDLEEILAAEPANPAAPENIAMASALKSEPVIQQAPAPKPSLVQQPAPDPIPESIPAPAPVASSAPAPKPTHAPQAAPVNRPPVQAAPPLKREPQDAPHSIQTPPTPKPLPPKPEPRMADPALPPLTHIANIPTGVRGVVGAPAMKPVQPPPRPIIKPASSSISPSSVPDSSQVIGSQPTPQSEISAVAPTELQHGGETFKINQIDDLKNLTLGHLRKYEWQSIVNTLKEAIAEQGYFQILQIVEQTSLYDLYILSGKNRLQGKESDLTQEEFEFMTDLLSHMRFNRL